MTALRFDGAMVVVAMRGLSSRPNMQEVDKGNFLNYRPRVPQSYKSATVSLQPFAIPQNKGLTYMSRLADHIAHLPDRLDFAGFHVLFVSSDAVSMQGEEC